MAVPSEFLNEAVHQLRESLEDAYLKVMRQWQLIRGAHDCPFGGNILPRPDSVFPHANRAGQRGNLGDPAVSGPA